MVERIAVTVNGHSYTVEIEDLSKLDGAGCGTPASGATVEVRVNGQPCTVRLGPSATSRCSTTGAESPPAAPSPAARAPAESVKPIEPAPQAVAAPLAGAPQPAPLAGAPQPAPKSAPVAGQQVTAPMPGKILSVAVQPGTQVQAKDLLCTLEAMKMEMSIASPVAGIVREVRAQVGANVVFGDLLFVID